MANRRKGIKRILVLNPISGANFLDNPEAIVDVSESGDGSRTRPVSEWLRQK